jgi:hypothetical protein
MHSRSFYAARTTGVDSFPSQYVVKALFILEYVEKTFILFMVTVQRKSSITG